MVSANTSNTTETQIIKYGSIHTSHAQPVYFNCVNYFATETEFLWRRCTFHTKTGKSAQKRTALLALRRQQKSAFGRTPKALF